MAIFRRARSATAGACWLSLTVLSMRPLVASLARASWCASSALPLASQELLKMTNRETSTCGHSTPAASSIMCVLSLSYTTPLHITASLCNVKFFLCNVNFPGLPQKSKHFDLGRPEESRICFGYIWAEPRGILIGLVGNL